MSFWSYSGDFKKYVSHALVDLGAIQVIFEIFRTEKSKNEL